MCPQHFFREPLPRDSAALGDMIQQNQLIELMEKRRRLKREGLLGSNVTVLRSGLIDTMRGTVLNSDQALGYALKLAAMDQQNCLSERILTIRKYVR